MDITHSDFLQMAMFATLTLNNLFFKIGLPLNEAC